jgi:hypothetical protein
MVFIFIYLSINSNFFLLFFSVEKEIECEEAQGEEEQWTLPSRAC